ncbi:MAG: urease accessory protein UreD [Muricoprocola sp.]
MENKFGRVSEVRLETELREDKVILSDVYFTAPFKVMQPFYLRPDYMQVMVLSASAGIMEGDIQQFFLRVKEGTSMEYLSQAYEKIHKMKEGKAERHTKIIVEKNAFLKYAPLPTIPFKDSAFENHLEVELEDDSSAFLFQEILSCGRAACQEKFEYRMYHNQVWVRKNGELIYRDNTRYEPALWEMSGLGMYEGYTHMANQIFFNLEKTDKWMEEVRELLDETEGVEGGVTRITSGDVAVRILGKGSENLLKLLEKIQEK